MQTFAKIRIRISELLKNKYYSLLLILTAVCSYGFLVTHSTVGIDDTPYAYYFEEGLVAIVGRWVLYIVNKVFSIAEYAPFLTDFAGVLILMLAVTAWAALFMDIFMTENSAKRLHAYCGFATVFLSCPLISEVYTYHLHNGISIGYLCVSISLWYMKSAFDNIAAAKTTMSETHGIHEKCSMKKGILNTLISAVFLWVSIGCYESMMVVWLLGICLVLLSERYVGIRRNILKCLLTALGAAAAGMILRSLMINAVTVVFDIGYMKDDAVQRSIGEMASWLFEPGAKSEFAMVIKRLIVMYGAFAYAYYPIKIFVCAVFIMTITAIIEGIRKKDIWILLFTLGAFAVSFLLAVVEGKATLYRSAQFLPVICGYGMFTLIRVAVGICGRLNVGNTKVRVLLSNVVKAAAGLIFAVVLWNQCADMNRWFYIDYVKYENACTLAGQIYYDIAEKFDTEKPVVFTGNYDIPQSIIQDAYVEYGSETFFKINRITSMIDEHLLEKFYRSYGVWVAQTPSLSVIDWGRYAFDDDSELVKFFDMLGFKLQPLTDTDYAPIEEYSKQLPEYPAEGSIVDMGDYIIVHF